MQEIRCPKCGEVFVVDESGYNRIVKQVRDKEFDKADDLSIKKLTQNAPSVRKMFYDGVSSV